MSESWSSIPVRDVKIGDRIRHRGEEFSVARIDQKFLGMDAMVCFIEDTAERWRAYPAGIDAEVEIARLAMT
jgi:hypothetical protein